MQKVIVIGSPGAGKSTFARKLKEVTNLPLHYLDMLWHKSDRTTISKEEFDTKLMELLKMERWIIDGNYLRTIETRMQLCDTVFLMDFPVEVCLFGIESRIGKKREDLPWFEYELDEEFRQYVIDFKQKKYPYIYKLIKKYENDKDIIIFKTREETDEYLKMISK